MRTELKIGMLLFSCTLVLRQFADVPEVLMGFSLGLSICFVLIGTLPESAYRRLKRWKRALLHRN